MSLADFKASLDVSTKRDRGVISVGNIPRDFAKQQLDVLLFLDISGSMGDVMYFTDGETKVQTDKGYNILDYAKWSVMLVVESMRPDDTFVLVGYTDTAHVVFSGKMTTEGKAECRARLSEMKPLNATNFERAIDVGFRETEKLIGTSSGVHWIFATDGIPNAGQIEGLPDTVAKECMKQEARGMHIEITTIALGKKADTRFLNRMNVCGTLIHSVDPPTSILQLLTLLVSRMRCTAVDDVWIGIEASKMQHVKFQDGELAPGTPHLKRAIVIADGISWTRIGTIRCDAIQCAVVDARNGTAFPADSAKIYVSTGHPFVENTLEKVFVVEPSVNDARVTEETWLAQIINGLLTGANQRPYGLHDLKTVFAEICAARTPELRAAMQDVVPTMETEMIPAYDSPTTFKIWGKDYGRAIAMALLRKEQTNQFDAALRKYSTAFDDEMTTLFVSQLSAIVPPPPSRTQMQMARAQEALDAQAQLRGVSQSDVAASRTRSAKPEVMFRGGGCFSHDSKIPVLEHDSIILRDAQDVTRDMRLVTDHRTKSYVTVLQQTKTTCRPLTNTKFVRIGDIKVTMWHPVRVASSFPQWQFPCKLEGFERTDESVACVYNFLTDGAYFADADNTHFVLLGHNLQEDVVRHEKWGEKIRGTLEAHADYGSFSRKCIELN